MNPLAAVSKLRSVEFTARCYSCSNEYLAVDSDKYM